MGYQHRHHRQLPDGRVVHIAGWRPDSRKDLHKDLHLAVPSPPEVAALPSHVTLTDLPPVWDQGQQGSCTANGGTFLYEYLEHKGLTDVLYSRAYCYARTRLLEGTPLGDDSGCQVRDVLKVMAKFGLCLEKTMPYDGDIYSVAPSAAADAEAAGHRATLYLRASTAKAQKASLAAGFPVIFGFTVYESMMSDAVARTGLVPFPGRNDAEDGGHCTVKIGYDDTKVVGACVGAWFCRNSWGKNWGLQGNFWLPYEYGIRGLDSDNWSLRRAVV